MAIERSDFLILGGGTAGCVLANRLSAGGATVMLVEAGPDYGALDSDRWPAELIDPRAPCDTHDWYPGAEFSLSRARVIGGCSAHNACFVTYGDARDYDEWGDHAPGWDFESLRPFLERAEAMIATRRLTEEEIPPWAAVVLEAAQEAGIPVLERFNDLTVPEAVGYVPVNVKDSTRWSPAFAYLDPARERPNLTVLGDALVDRITLEDDRATGAVAITESGEIDLAAETVVLCAGAFGSPGVLLRSGIGPSPHLEELGIEVIADRPGVGENLQDHCGVNIVFGAAAGLIEELEAKAAGNRMIGSGTMVRAQSGICEPDTWDLHLVTWCAPDATEISGASWRVQLSPYVMKPAATGNVRLRSSAPDQPLNVDLGFLSDPEGADLDVLLDGVELVRRIAGTEPFAAAIEAEAVPGPQIADRDRIADWAREAVRGYFHPVGTCRMGSTEDPMAVVDGGCKVHGIEDAYVVDAAVMPSIHRANTNLTTIAIAERIAEGLLD